MTPSGPTERGHDDVLDAYREAAWAEADAHFDDRALDAQRQRIQQRLAHLGQPARVIPFPGRPQPARPALRVHRRWISVAAAAGLVVGLLGGQVLHEGPARFDRGSIVVRGPVAAQPLLRPVALTADDGFLQEVEAAVELHPTAELRALDELTPFLDAR